MVVLIPHFLGGLVIALLLGGPVIATLKRLKARQVISLDAPQRHQTKAGTPVMGGLIFVLAGALVVLLSPARSPGALALLLLTLAFAGIGALDDTLIIVRGKNLGLKARQKLALQIAGAVAFVFWYHNPATALTRPDAGLAAALGLFHILLIVGLSNAVN